LDQDFFDIAGQIAGRGTRRLARKVMKDVFAVYGRVSGIGLEQYYRDIETRWELGTFAASQNRPKDWKARKEDLEELVRRVIIHTTADLDQSPAMPHNSRVHSDILRHVNADDTLITFNYDTVIEESMPMTTPWTPRDGYGVDASGITHDWVKGWLKRRKLGSAKSSKVCLLKLMGASTGTCIALAKCGSNRGRMWLELGEGGQLSTKRRSYLPDGTSALISIHTVLFGAKRGLGWRNAQHLLLSAIRYQKPTLLLRRSLRKQAASEHHEGTCLSSSM
jgi:hypothetical protein